MQTVSTLYSAMIAEEHDKEYRLDIAGNTLYQTGICALSRTGQLFPAGNPSAGNCIAEEIELTILAPDFTIPRRAKLEPYVRLTDGTQTSGWIRQGIYYISTRDPSKNADGLDVVDIHGYDALALAQAEFPDTNISFPAKDITLVRLIAKELGITLDSLTTEVMTAGYTFPLPVGYTMQEVLCRVAAAYGANWMMTNDGKLRLVPLWYSAKDNGTVLGDRAGNAITIGGMMVLV